MSNALLNYKNWIDTEYADSAVSVAALSSQTSYPVANVRAAVNAQLSNPHRTKKSAGRYGGYAIDLGTVRSVRTASLHRLVSSTVRGRFRVQAAAVNLLENPALWLDFLRGETDGRTYPNDLDSRITFSCASGHTFWRGGQLFGLELVDVGSPAIALTTAETTWTVRSGGKWAVGDPVYVYPQDGTANISLTATVSAYSGTTLTLSSITAGSDTTTTKTAFYIAYRGPRLDSHPVTKARRGLLVEPARTNLLTYSEQIDNAAWTKDGSSVSADAATAPDGATSMDRVVESNTNALHRFYKSGITASGTATVSAFVKAGSRHIVSIELGNGTTQKYVIANLSDGSLDAASDSSARIEAMPNGIYRISVAHSLTGSSNSVACYLHDAGGLPTTYAGDGASYAHFWGLQLEVGSEPTSYIWTGAATRSRSADVVTNTGSDFTDWYVQGPGALYVEAVPLSAAAAQAGLVALSDGTTGEELRLSFDSSGNLDFDVTDGSSAQASIDSGEEKAAGKLFKVAAAWAGDDFAISASGKTAVTDTSGSLPSPDQMKIGAIGDGTAGFVGHIRMIAAWNMRLADARLAALTNRGAPVNTNFTACSVDVPLYCTFSRSAGGTYTDANGTTSGSYDFTAASQAAGSGSKTFPIGAGLDIKVGQRMRIVPQDATANISMIGEVTAYSGAIATVNVVETGSDRSTTKTAWTMGLLGPRFDYSSGTALGIKLDSTDTLTIAGDEFTARWRSDAMTVVVEATAPSSLSGTQTLLSIDDGTAAERIELVSSSGTLQVVVVDGGVAQATMNLGTLTASTKFRAAVRIKANDLSGSLDGAAVVTDTSATLPAPTTLRAGKDNGGSDAWTGHLGRLILKPEAHADADLVAMATAGADLSDYTLPGALADAYAGDVDTGWLLNRRSYGTGDLPEGVTEFTRYAWTVAQTYRYWRVDMVEPLAPDSDPPTADDGLALDVGYLGIWHGYQFTRNPAYGAVRGFRSNSQEQRALGGARIVDRRGTPRTWALQFDAQDETDADALEDATAFLDKDLPCLLVLDPSDNSGFFRTDKLGQQVSLENREYATFGLYRTAIGVEEIVG